jgi:hypothetical protein
VSNVLGEFGTGKLSSVAASFVESKIIAKHEETLKDGDCIKEFFFIECAAFL